MDHKQQEQVALHRWAVIAEAASDRLTAAERGALVRQIAARAHTHPDGTARRYSRGTIDRWLRAWRAGGLAALQPSPRADTGTVRAHPELFAEAAALRLDGRFYGQENARACQDLLRRAVTRRGLPEVFYCDNGAPFSNAWLARTCAVLGIRLVHSQPYSPEGRGKQERLNRYIREAFLAEATHRGIESLDELNDLFAAWAERVANRRAHAETRQAPIDRFQAAGPPRQASPDLIREAFRWSVARRVTRT